MDIRAARPADAMEMATVHVRSWQAAYTGLLPAEYLANLQPRDRAQRYRFVDDPTHPTTLVACDDGVVIGFATIGAARDADANDAGELLALYVDPQAWDRGVGRALMVAARTALAARGFHVAVLWVMVGNERAERFYRIDGWMPDQSRRHEVIWGIGVDEIRYRRVLR